MENKKTMTKKDKIIIGLVIVLILGVTIQTSYIFKLKDKIDASQTESLSLRKQTHMPTRSQGGYARQNTLDSWDPFEEMERMQQNMNRMFRNSLWRGGLDFGFDDTNRANSFFEPDADIQEKKDHYLLRLDIPGMEKDNIELSVENGYITITGVRDSESREESDDGRFFRAERSYGKFHRSIPLPGEIKEEGISAEYKKGVLTIKMPKVKEEMTSEDDSKKIPIM